MQSSKAYEYLIKQLNATGSEKKDGYNPRVLEEIYDWERDEAEDLIWNAFYRERDTDILVLFPKLKKYDGIKALKKIVDDYEIPSETNILISYLLYQNTRINDKYLKLIEMNIVKSNYNYSYIASISDLKPSKKVYKMLIRIYERCTEKIALSATIDAILFNKGFIKDIFDINQVQKSEFRELRMIFKQAPLDERKTMITKLENGEFDQYK